MVQLPSPPLTTKRRKPLTLHIRVVGTPKGGAEIAAIASSTPSLSLGKTRKTQFQRCLSPYVFCVATYFVEDPTASVHFF
jgi:hypothetical protein